MKKNIAILMGGDSAEYEVSLSTAKNIYALLDPERYAAYLVHVKNTEWNCMSNDGKSYPVDKNDFTVHAGNRHLKFDAVFIAIHGTPGENGLFQGYFDMLKIPYTGCGTFCSALTFNKFFCNVVVKSLGIPVAPSLHFYRGETIDNEQVAATCGYPCFVKPCNSGSSVGVSKVSRPEDLFVAIEEALKHDHQLMIEQFVPGRELTCGVSLQAGKPHALAVTEIKSAREYYDYQAKYRADCHELITPANISEKSKDLIIQYSETIYKRLNCKGVVRVDYILSNREEIPYFLEINTIPGQTDQSIIPRQVKYAGISLVDFYAGLIEECLHA
ncbi:MAG: D-alanine--D-alanine ligase [Bacteroidales bacterium]|jgi:D-alanine-D-alanine ligase|nr:D-alanine--D-alanine ligase [Bacteroidales bacterium]